MKKLCFLLVIGLLPVGCAAMQKAWREANCNYDGAYSAGMNDAREGKRMNTNFGYLCTADQETIKAAYREGYTAGASGGGVVQLTVATAGTERQCLKGYGKEVCGYDCVKGYGDVRCAVRPGDNCVKAYGKIRCGRNCRSEYGNIVCD